MAAPSYTLAYSLAGLTLACFLASYLLLTGGSGGDVEGSGRGPTWEDLTKSSERPATCLSGHGFFLSLLRPRAVAGNSSMGGPGEGTVVGGLRGAEGTAAASRHGEEEPPAMGGNGGPGPPPVPSDDSQNMAIIYQIIFALMLVCLTASIVELFQERSKRKKNMEDEGKAGEGGGGSRRMSLADLTISRHIRKESQASFRPLGPRAPRLIRRSSMPGQEMQAKLVIMRQISCPQPHLRKLPSVDLAEDDNGCAERRRVRMIQRH